MDIQAILNRFDGAKPCGEDGQYIARCPCHDDQRQSLSINIKGKAGVLLKCHAGCDYRDILSKVGLSPSDLFYAPKQPASEHQQPDRPQVVKIYTYPDGSQKLRKTDKSFSWRRPDGNGGWIWNRQGLKPCLYVAGEMSDYVLVAEGEKDADNLHELTGQTAVSGADGAGPGKWKPEYTEQLRGRSVCIFADNDSVGRSYAEETAAALHGVAESVTLCDLRTVWPEIPEKNDISDLIAHFGDEKAIELITELASNTPEYQPPAPAPPHETEKPRNVFAEFGFYSVPDLTEEERRPPEFIIDGILPCGMTFLSGAPKTRKSFLALQMAIAVATGTPFLGHATKQCDVAYLDLEGNKSRISSRTDKMSIPVPRNVHFTNSIEECLADNLVERLRQLHREMPDIRLVIVDPYGRSRGDVKNRGGNAYDVDVRLLEPVQRMAIEENIALLFIHHDKKGAGLVQDSFERLSGTMGISGSCDCVINFIADGKRFDGKAKMEFTPRDAKGGEMNLAFDECHCEWNEDIDQKPDLRNNPLCAWIISHVPGRHLEGQTFPYDYVVREAYRTCVDNPGEVVLKVIAQYREELFAGYGIGVQTGVKTNGARGIRLINLL